MKSLISLIVLYAFITECHFAKGRQLLWDNACFLRGKAATGYKDGPTLVSDEMILLSDHFSPKHRLKSIRSCTNAYDQLLGVQLTLHVPSVPSSDLPLNVFGTLLGKCEIVDLIENTITSLSISYSHSAITRLQITTGNSTKSFGETPQDSTMTDNINFTEERPLIGFFGTMTDGVVTSLGIIFYKTDCPESRQTVEAWVSYDDQEK